MTFGSDLIISFIELSSPLKSGISDSTIVVGHKSLIALIVLAICSAPPSCRSSLHTDVITTYLKPHSLIALATLSGSSGSRYSGLPLTTEQNLHPLVHASPMIIMVAVPPPQHSPMFGHRASSQTV